LTKNGAFALQMAIFSFKTIHSPATGLYKEKGSKFIALAFPAETEVEVNDRLGEVRKEYFDARHHCYAYVLGADKKKFRANDDGEPNHSAGDPILGQIRSRGLTNVLVIVVRYFGGVKLGVGGLIAAYKAAAEDSLRNARIIERDLLESLIIEYEYSLTPEVMRLVKEFDLTIVDQMFEGSCRLKVLYRLMIEQPLREKISALARKGLRVLT
jgi:uncharacterized YigZ family protein